MELFLLIYVCIIIVIIMIVVSKYINYNNGNRFIILH